MRIFMLTTLVMLAFAGNPLLTRAGLTGGGLSAVEFAVVRLGSGAVILAILCFVLRGNLKLGGQGRWIGVASLLLYLFGFSAAYTDLQSGIGALVLFGMVQITMFAGALLVHEDMPLNRWLGAGLAFVGLAWLLWPVGVGAISPVHGLMMAGAGIGWGIYSLAGRKEPDALQATTANFIVASVVALAIGLASTGGSLVMDITHNAHALGLWLAVASGAITSGLGYALWYAVLPRLAGSVAAVAQLTVPVITMVGGILWLGESLTTRFVLASVLVLGGVVISISPGHQNRKT